MGLFNAHAVAQQRADRITAILHSLVDGNLDVAIGEAPAVLPADVGSRIGVIGGLVRAHSPVGEQLLQAGAQQVPVVIVRRDVLVGGVFPREDAHLAAAVAVEDVVSLCRHELPLSRKYDTPVRR